MPMFQSTAAAGQDATTGLWFPMYSLQGGPWQRIGTEMYEVGNEAVDVAELTLRAILAMNGADVMCVSQTTTEACPTGKPPPPPPGIMPVESN